MAKAGRGADQYMLRLPEGLRDRIKAYSERMGTSINSEIVKVLEREFPEQWSLDTRMEDLTKMLSVLSAGKEDPRLDEFIEKFEETVEGIVSGRVTGVDPDTRDAIYGVWRSYKEREGEAAYDEEQERQMDYTEEELQAYEITGRFEKYAEPPPKKLDPFRSKLDLLDVLGPKTLEQLAETLGKGDLESAAKVVLQVPKEELQERIKLLQLPLTEQYRLRDEEHADHDIDPFKS